MITLFILAIKTVICAILGGLAIYGAVRLASSAYFRSKADYDTHAWYINPAIPPIHREQVKDNEDV